MSRVRRGRSEWLLYLYAESPLHAGAADSAGVVDLPIQREAGTGYPVVWGQSLKGALRQAARDGGWDDDVIVNVFGSQPPGGADAGSNQAGLLSVGDAQLVALPVPTLRHTFAWVTSDLALSRLARKHTLLPEGLREALPVPPLAKDMGLAAHEAWYGQENQEVIGPMLVSLGESAELAAWAARLARDAIGAGPGLEAFAAKMRADLLAVGQDVMPELNRECTEVTARVQLNNGLEDETKRKTVEYGPFYSEYLPAETVLAASLSLRPDGLEELYAAELVQLLHGSLIQVGGDETLGKGLVWCRMVGPGAADDTPAPAQDAGTEAGTGTAVAS
ncbi:type III-B CRISPR module RAMP protein Cmr4 [Streptomyces filipinensis]|uniref:type III-B CRISPR module RAMP protein Cmr4 n=1 Tax=Streptomyces filipinensis TaxID=66887 RepID=UPI0036EF3726